LTLNSYAISAQRNTGQNKGEKMIYRQGDVLLRKTDKKVQGRKLNHCILAWGEVTGHKHQIKAYGSLYQTDNGMLLECLQDTVLEHEEHAPIPLEKGVYEVIQQREFDIVEGIKQVMD